MDSLTNGSIDSSIAAADLGDPVEPVAEDALDPALQGGRADRARAAGALELDLDDAGHHVGRRKHQVAAVGLHGRPHEVDQTRQGGEPLRPLLVGQRRGRALDVARRGRCLVLRWLAAFLAVFHDRSRPRPAAAGPPILPCPAHPSDIPSAEPRPAPGDAQAARAQAVAPRMAVAP